MSTLNPFFTEHVPSLWANLMVTFFTEVAYTLVPEMTTIEPLKILLKEGVSGEAYSPGRYSHAWVKHSDLPRPPEKPDWITYNGEVYDISSIDAQPYNVSMLVLHKAG